MAARAVSGTGRLAAPRGWREWRLALLAVVALVLAGCSGMSGMFTDDAADEGVPVPPGGGTKVALLLPLSGSGEVSGIAKALKQSAELALIDIGNPSITLVTKDTGGTGPGAQAAAQAALAEGAQLVLGPLLSAEVQAVAPVARQRGVPVIAFSSVSSTAGSGTYLMSFLPEEEVSNVVRYAVAKGHRTVAALYPTSPYGQTVEAALNRAVPRAGGTIALAERYERDAGAVAEPAARIGSAVADRARGIEALFLPEGGDLLKSLSRALETNGVDPNAVKVLGTGLWDDRVAPTTPIAQGGWYAGVPPDLVARFESKYAATYNTKPPRIASLAYDAVALASQLAKAGRISASGITDPDGFQGENGLFRFRQNGLIERGLAILEMTPSGPRVIEPAAARFSGS